MVPAVQFQEAGECYTSRKFKCLISSYFRLSDLYSLFPPLVLGLYFYYGNISHVALFSDVHICLPLLTMGHTVGRDYTVLSLHDPMYSVKPLLCLSICWTLKGIFEKVALQSRFESTLC